ncbi:probable serine/threonine-protein kinase fhkE [Drosophila subobscura]|uniref:probable serine/threonine-protein kinase fhkE n=1 Tax=Drosophila subobscura TaxID=7241 RepID=UPI00155B3373|nr:probable serine/threonine-protein kinase fhkE [Drosophila subobscura]
MLYRGFEERSISLPSSLLQPAAASESTNHIGSLNGLTEEDFVIKVIDKASLATITDLPPQNEVDMLKALQSHTNIVDLVMQFENYQHLAIMMQCLDYATQGVGPTPENMLVSRSGPDVVLELKICDFGLALAYEGELLTTICGSVDYMIEEHGYDYKTDCWSLGQLILFLMCYTRTLRNTRDKSSGCSWD